MPKGHSNFCQICGTPVERMGFKYGCWRCAVIINKNGGIVFPENENNPRLQESPPLRSSTVKDSEIPYNIFTLFKG